MKKFIIMGIMSVVCSLLDCQARTKRFRSVGVARFEKVIADTAVVRLDVRTPEEYAEGHIEGALNIDVKSDDFAAKAQQMLPWGRIVALYCRGGVRSRKAAGILAAQGYKVINLDKGFLRWTAAGKMVVK